MQSGIICGKENVHATVMRVGHENPSHEELFDTYFLSGAIEMFRKKYTIKE